uniref:Uncharacterized protein n=1 Tax=Anguilla anguilla TaxID=7936 RepID=A0A0E9QNV9_ANGAN
MQTFCVYSSPPLLLSTSLIGGSGQCEMVIEVSNLLSSAIT